MLSRLGIGTIKRPGVIRAMSHHVETPIVAVIGTTGTGKSQLAIELALAISGKRSDGPTGSWNGAKVVNADAMQMYKGLDIVTNKVTEEEKMGVEHLLMDICAPNDHYVVSNWVRDAMKYIDDMHGQKEVPVVAGGTLYWVQHLLFPNRLLSLENGEDLHQNQSHNMDTTPSANTKLSLAELSTEELTLLNNLPDRSRSEPDHLSEDVAWALHALLNKLDPPMGARWHWKDSRKIVRSLEIIRESGRKASDIFTDQHKDDTESRYPSLIFWLHAEQNQLDYRLDARVDKMINRGMVAEIASFRSLVNEMPKLATESEEDLDSEMDYTHGILQTIGFKEFDKYLSSPNKELPLFEEAVEQMKLATRKYAKRQVRWIKQKLLPVVKGQKDTPRCSTLVVLDATDLERWNENVKEPALRFLEDFLTSRPLGTSRVISQLPSLVLPDEKSFESTLQARKKITCPICTVDPQRPVMMEEGVEFERHRNTRQHRSRASRDRRMSEQLAMREEKQRERSERRAQAAS